jgi:hypothetical protein
MDEVAERDEVNENTDRQDSVMDIIEEESEDSELDDADEELDDNNDEENQLSTEEELLSLSMF